MALYTGVFPVVAALQHATRSRSVRDYPRPDRKINEKKVLDGTDNAVCQEPVACSDAIILTPC